MKATIRLETPILESPRVEQVRGLFDLLPEKTSSVSWDVHLPLTDQPWSLGLIVGPSGCGKSTIARRLLHGVGYLWNDDLTPDWQSSEALIDGLAPTLGIKESTELLSSVGLSSPPAWLRPYHVLSTGQKFRADLARLMSFGLTWERRTWERRPSPVLVMDEFTSTVDRTVAQIGSAAAAKAVRAKGLQFVAVTCHEDVQPWLQPDWVYRPAEGLFTWRSVQPRPQVFLSTFRASSAAWPLFRPHHYLSEALAPSAVCFLTTWGGRPVCFSAWLPFLGAGQPSRREHRTVCLPDYQGIGIGNRVSALLASMWKGLGYLPRSTTTHPAMIRARCRSPHWRMVRAPSLPSGREAIKHASSRLTAGFIYTGAAMTRARAQLLLGGS